MCQKWTRKWIPRWDSTHSVPEETLCCLCRCSVMEGTSLIKRNLFHGKACESAKVLLNDLLMENWQMPITSFKEKIDPKTYLCHHCFNKAKKCLDMIDNLKEKFDGLLSMASKLTPPTQPSCRKACF